MRYLGFSKGFFELVRRHFTCQKHVLVCKNSFFSFLPKIIFKALRVHFLFSKKALFRFEETVLENSKKVFCGVQRRCLWKF